MSEKINDVAIEKKGKKKKVVTIIVSCLLAALVIGGLAFHFWLKSTGKIIVPEFTQIAEDTYAYSEGMNQTNIYLLVGEERAVLIDTGNGLLELDEAVSKITDKPVFIINTHGHYDHIGGNRFYEEAWVPKLDEELFHFNNSGGGINSYYEDLSSFMMLFNKYNLRTILAIERPDTANYYTAGDTFDLGGRTLSTIALYGHTAGSTGMIDSKTGYLFCGDALVPVDAGLLMNLPESITIAEYREHLIELQKLVDDGTVTKLFSGHSDTFSMETDGVAKFITICDNIISGKLTDKEKDNCKAGYEGVYICYNPDKIQ